MSESFCKQTDCDERTGCIFGELNPNDCEHRETDDSSQQSSTEGYSIPWHGSAFGLSELQYVATRQRPWLVGVVGPHNAGKTTFLTSIYLMLSQGARFPNRTFAGSYTLRAWEALANNLRYPNQTEPMFPRHTPVTTDRVPGLLHLAFRQPSNRLEDVLFTDAPGEWFSNWVKDRKADNAAGARWIASYADTFLFFVDSEELCGDRRGVARSLITSLAQRLSDEVANRDVIVLWSKSDRDIGDEMKRQIMSRLSKYLPDAQHISISVMNDSRTGIQDAADAAVNGRSKLNNQLALNLAANTADPFLQFQME